MAKSRTQRIRIRNHRVVLNRTAGGDTAIFVFLCLFGVIMVLPLYYTIMQSFKPLDEMFYYPPRFYAVNPTINNYRDLFTLLSTSWVPFSRYIFNTVIYTITGLAGNLLLSSLCAYAIAKIPFPGSNGVFWLIQKSLMIGSSVGGIISFVIITGIGWMDNPLAVIVPSWCSTLGLYLMKQFMETNIHPAVLESARLDGASEFRIFLEIGMPMVKPAWLTCIIYSFGGLWGMGSSVYLQSENLKTLTCAAGQMLSAGIARTGASCALGVIMMAVPMLVFVFSQSQIIETMSSSGMKD